MRRIGGIAVVLVLMGAAASPTSASVTSAGGYKYVSHELSAPDGYHADAEAKCPNGTHVLGGGLSDTAPAGQIVVHHSAPLDGGDSDHVADNGWQVAFESSGDRTVKVRAICGDRPVSYVKDHFTADAGTGTSPQPLACPDGSRPMSGGTTGPYKTLESASEAGSGAWGVTVDSASGNDQTVKQYAVCADFNIIGTGTGESVGGNDGGSATVQCSEGRFVVGGGMSSTAGPHGFTATALAPTDAHDGWKVRGFNYTFDEILMSVSATCAKPAP